jgi:3-hydroxybutyryl-CoA dehydrogenase
MTVAILADAALKTEFCNRTFPAGCELVFADSIRSLTIIEADVYFDLEFVNDVERNRKLATLLPKPVVINWVSGTCKELPYSFIRINAWPTMLMRPLAEIAAPPEMEEPAASIFASLNWQSQVSPDQPGMITPRIVSGIINEALFALEEGVSTESEIDLAMKLGTNYPYGPFEWLALIGKERVFELLRRLSQDDPHYQVAPLINTAL